MDNQESKIISALSIAAAGGDKKSLSELIERIQPILKGVIASHLRDRSQTEDILQNTLIKILQVLPRLDKDIKHLAYFTSISKNEISEFYRKEKKATSSIDEIEENGYHFSTTDAIELEGESSCKQIIDLVFSIKSSPEKRLVYLYNGILYPVQTGKYKGNPSKLYKRFGERMLRFMLEEMIKDFNSLMMPLSEDNIQRSTENLQVKKNDIAYAVMILSDLLGSNPLHTISLWTDRLNKKVIFEISKTIH